MWVRLRMGACTVLLRLALFQFGANGFGAWGGIGSKPKGMLRASACVPCVGSCVIASVCQWMSHGAACALTKDSAFVTDIRQYGNAPRYFLIENFLPSLRSQSLCLSINSFHSLSFEKHLLAYLQYIYTVYTLHTHNVAVATAAASCSLFCSFFSVVRVRSFFVFSILFWFSSLLHFARHVLHISLPLSLCLSFSFL